MGLVLFLSASKHIWHTTVHQIRAFLKTFSCSLSLFLSLCFTFCLSLSPSIYLYTYIPLFHIPLFLTHMFVCFALSYVHSCSACASQSLAVSHLLSEILPQGSSTRTKIMSDYTSDSQVSQSTFVSHLLCNISRDFPSTAAIFDQIIAQLCSCSCPLECFPLLEQTYLYNLSDGVAYFYYGRNRRRKETSDILMDR